MIHTEHDLWSKYVQYSTGGVMACNGSTVQGWDVRFDNYILLSDSALSPEWTLIGTQGATLAWPTLTVCAFEPRVPGPGLVIAGISMAADVFATPAPARVHRPIMHHGVISTM